MISITGIEIWYKNLATIRVIKYWLVRRYQDWLLPKRSTDSSEGLQAPATIRVTVSTIACCNCLLHRHCNQLHLRHMANGDRHRFAIHLFPDGNRLTNFHKICSRNALSITLCLKYAPTSIHRPLYTSCTLGPQKMSKTLQISVKVSTILHSALG